MRCRKNFSKQFLVYIVTSIQTLVIVTVYSYFVFRFFFFKVSVSKARDGKEEPCQFFLFFFIATKTCFIFPNTDTEVCMFCKYCFKATFLYTAPSVLTAHKHGYVSTVQCWLIKGPPCIHSLLKQND